MMDSMNKKINPSEFRMKERPTSKGDLMITLSRRLINSVMDKLTDLVITILRITN